MEMKMALELRKLMSVLSRNMLLKVNIGLFLMLLFLVSKSANAQTDIKELMSVGNKLDYGIQFRAGPSDRKNFNELVLSEYTGFYLSSDLLSMRYELSLVARLNSKWAFFAGATYSSRNYFASYYCHVCDLDIHPLESKRFEFSYLDVPLYARYRLLDRKIAWHIEFGAEVSFALNWLESHSEPEIRLNNYSINAFIGTGLDYDLNKRINLNATCSYRSLMYSDSNYKFRAIEVKAGIVYYFNSKKIQKK